MPADEQARRLFAGGHGGSPSIVVRAPGRVNLIGDHTDYNDGFVLPMAISPATWIAARPRSDRTVSIVSEGFEPAEFSLDELTRGGPPWAEYVKGVAWSLGPGQLAGWDGAVATDITIDAGLSSSAALELAAVLAFAAASGIEVKPVAAALAAQRAENEWVGMPSGIMDQLTIAMGRRDHALLIDCRSLAVTPHRLPESVVVAIVDSGTRRQLVGSEYEERRETCEAVACAYGVAALRDLTIHDLGSPPDAVTPVGLRRARHVVTENARVLEAAGAMDDAVRLGGLMIESHASLRDDYEVSTPALDDAVAAAIDAPGCFGARLTGAGFGGSAVALVDATGVDDFRAAMAGRSTVIVAAGDGARVFGQDGGS